ncbi:DMT family transporter [Streptomyces sp. ST2-7A]|uniref:DMT family transporter n=1 Tax=Streptomyces sp. ST2-7A TaxID=2907214 RepID=UPI001F3ED815|nr:DMT family transporter [Streptomyces sp. ST2-7A]MCE7078961.1 DMT family transporter [Streptomyces sp. ST2-7A]
MGGDDGGAPPGPGTSRSGVARVGVLALLWGSTFLWIDLALTDLTPGWITLLRCALGAGVLLVWCRRAGSRLPRGRGRWGAIAVAAALCNTLPFLLLARGQQEVDSGVAGVLNATTPLWSLLLALLVGTERRPGPVRVGGVVLGLTGVALILAPWRGGGTSLPGALAVLGAALSYALAFVYMSRRLVGRGVPVPALAAAQLLAATVAAVPLALLTGEGWRGPTGGGGGGVGATALLAVLVLGTACTAVTFLLTYRIIAREGATDAAAVGYLLPVVAVLLGASVLGEEIGPRMVLGTAVVLLAVAMIRHRSRPARTVGPPDASPGSPSAGTGRKGGVYRTFPRRPGRNAPTMSG